MTSLIEEPQDKPHGDEFDLTFEVSDGALEAAADTTPVAFSFVGSPTVSVLVACCSG
jgi:hypothetical protein